jgi:hypothetical protein
MRVLGIDFTSQPQRAKPLAVAEGRLERATLTIEQLVELASFAEYEALLRAPGPWVAAVDHPFGLPADFVAAVGWPRRWEALVAHVAGLSRAAFRETVADFLAPRPPRSKYLRRRVEQRVFYAASPLNLVRPPVGLMFLEGAPRLLASGATILPCRPGGDPERIAVEGYPAMVARALNGREPYKEGGWRAGRARMAVLDALDHRLEDAYGLHLRLPEPLRTNALLDERADLLDAVLCAVQAAWAARRAGTGYGIPPTAPRLEGWIADPALAPDVT